MKPSVLLAGPNEPPFSTLVLQPGKSPTTIAKTNSGHLYSCISKECILSDEIMKISFGGKQNKNSKASETQEVTSLREEEGKKILSFQSSRLMAMSMIDPYFVFCLQLDEFDHYIKGISNFVFNPSCGRTG